MPSQANQGTNIRPYLHSSKGWRMNGRTNGSSRQSKIFNRSDLVHFIPHVGSMFISTRFSRRRHRLARSPAPPPARVIRPSTHSPIHSPIHPVHPLARPFVQPLARSPARQPAHPTDRCIILSALMARSQKAFHTIRLTQAMWYPSPLTDRLLGNGRPTPSPTLSQDC